MNLMSLKKITQMKSDRNGSLTQGQDWKIGGIKNQSWVCMIKIALELLTFGQCQSLACTVDSTLSLSESTPGGGGGVYADRMEM